MSLKGLLLTFFDSFARRAFGSSYVREERVSFIIQGLPIKTSVGTGSYGKIRVHSYQLDCQVEIGRYTAISDITCILGGNLHRGLSIYPFKDSNEDHEKTKGIKIGSDCWIGYGACLMDGVRINDGAIIGAKSIITKDVEPYCIVAGNPARIIGYRFTKSEIEQLLSIRWWDLPESFIFQNQNLFYSNDVTKLVGEVERFNASRGHLN